MTYFRVEPKRNTAKKIAQTMSLKRSRSSFEGSLEYLKDTIPYYLMEQETKHFKEADMKKQKANIKTAMATLEAWLKEHPVAAANGLDHYISTSSPAPFKYTDLAEYALNNEYEGKFGDWFAERLEPFTLDIESDDTRADTLLWKRCAAVFRLVLARFKATARITAIVHRIRFSTKVKFDEANAKALFDELKKQKSVWVKGGEDEFDSDDAAAEAKIKAEKEAKTAKARGEDDDESSSSTSTSSGGSKSDDVKPGDDESSESSPSSESSSSSSSSSSGSESETDDSKAKDKSGSSSSESSSSSSSSESESESSSESEKKDEEKKAKKTPAKPAKKPAKPVVAEAETPPVKKKSAPPPNVEPKKKSKLLDLIESTPQSDKKTKRDESEQQTDGDLGKSTKKAKIDKDAEADAVAAAAPAEKKEDEKAANGDAAASAAAATASVADESEKKKSKAKKREREPSAADDASASGIKKAKETPAADAAAPETKKDE